MLIFIDARHLGGRIRGIGFFLRNMLEALAHACTGHRFLLLVESVESIKGMALPSQTETVVTRIPPGLAEITVLPWLLNRRKPDLAWFPANNCAPFIRREIAVVSTIHDLMFYSQSPPLFSRQWLGSRYRRVFSHLAFRRADLLHTVTGHNVGLLAVRSSRARDDIFYTYHGVNITPRTDLSILARLGLDHRPYLYTITGTSPNKNLETAIASFIHFSRFFDTAGYRLVVTGVPRYERYRQRHRLPPEVVFTPYITNEQKSALLSRCRLFLFLSREEGFGMPPSEAAFFGKGIVASDIPPLRELYGNIATFVPHDDVHAIARGIAGALRSEPGYDPRELLRKLDWGKSAAELLRRFEEVARERGTGDSGQKA